MNDFLKPQHVDDLTLAFPADVAHLMPCYEDIPDEFKNYPGTFWNKWQAEWFYRGLQASPHAKPGIDLEMALRHLWAIQGSFQPKHEHKEAAVAYLASLWLEEVQP